MVGSEPGDDRGERRPADRDESTGGIFDVLRHVVDTLRDAENSDDSTFGGGGRLGDGRFATEYGFSGRIGPVIDDPDAVSGETEPEADTHGRYRIDTRYDEDGDELLVVADLPAVAAEELTVGIDRARNELVVGVADHVVERLSIPWAVAHVESRYNHGVLQIHVKPTEVEE